MVAGVEGYHDRPVKVRKRLASGRARKAVRAQARQQVKPQAFEDPRLRAVARLVHAAGCRSGRVSLREAARVACYSPQHFSEFFHDRVGLSFDTWQFAQRMKQAEDLLVQKPWMQADAIADAVGYSDVSVFSRAFKRYAGISWRQLKRLARECPRVAAGLDAIEHLDDAYRLAVFAERSPDTASVLLRLAERMQNLSKTAAAF